VQLLRGKVTGTDKFAATPRDVTDADYGSVSVEGDAEHFGNCERADFDAYAAGRNIEDEAFEPRRVGRGNDETRSPIFYAFMPAGAEVFAVSHDHPSNFGIIWQISCAAVRRKS
jgi:hypothetical protein